MYGTQTALCFYADRHMFENDVKMYGTQTVEIYENVAPQFENDVKFIFANNKDR